MHKEIGSEFYKDCTPLLGNGVKEIVPRGFDVQYTLSGRTAQELILRDALCTRKIRKAYLPSYCCHTMIEPFLNHHIEVRFYDVTWGQNGWKLGFEEENDCDLIFLMEYFGFSDSTVWEIAKAQKQKGKLVLYDATHSVFMENMDYSAADYVSCSLRKWMNVNAGFCAKNGSWEELPALIQNTAYTALRNACFRMKAEYLQGENVEKQSFLDGFAEAEELLEHSYVGFAPDPASLQLLSHVDVSFIRERRRKNAKILLNRVSNIAVFPELQQDDCPLFVPVLLPEEKRNALRKFLIERRIYCPVHWHVSELHRLDPRTARIYHQELSLICDQRYEQADILRQAETIKEFMGW